MFSRVQMRTSDGVTLSGNYFETTKPEGWIVYLHMMPATKSSYTSLAEKFQEAGFSGIAIDFRGHGDSDGGPEGYANFSDQQHQKKYDDAEAAVAFLLSKNADDARISFIGASVGANVALGYVARHRHPQKIVLLSPGLNYRGITTKDLVTKLAAGTKILFVGSEDDNYIVECIDELYGLVPEGVIKEKIIYKDAGHGTTMLERGPALAENIIKFIKE